MAKSAADVFLALQGRYIKLDRTSAKVNKLHAVGKISAFDVEQIYSGIYLDAFVSLERFIEDLFLGYVSGQVTLPTKAAKPLVTISPSSKAKEVMLGGKNFLDWIPYDANTKKRAQIYFNGNSSFLSLSKQDENLLGQLHQIRNALAHRSTHSIGVFHRLVVGNLPIVPRDKRPGNFLRTIFRANPSQTRLQYYLFEMLEIAKRLSE